jgi:hypothetical protein
MVNRGFKQLVSGYKIQVTGEMQAVSQRGQGIQPKAESLRLKANTGCKLQVASRRGSQKGNEATRQRGNE